MRTLLRSLALLLLAGAVPACIERNNTGDIYPPITTAAPLGGAYAVPQTVVLTADDNQNPFPFGPNPLTIYYSTDGVDPAVGAANTSLGPTPLGGIVIPSGTTTLKFFAVDSSGNVETVRTEVYVIP